MSGFVQALNRRRFVQFLAASPLCHALSGIARADDAPGMRVDTAGDAIDVFDLEMTASGNIPAAHWGYL